MYWFSVVLGLIFSDLWQSPNFERNCEVSKVISILLRKLFCFRRDFRQCKPWNFEMLVRDGCIEFFQIYHGMVSPILFSHKKRLLRNSFWAVSDFWIAPFPSNSDISWSTSRDCCSDNFIEFWGFSWNARFVNGIWYPFTIGKFLWSRVIFFHCFRYWDSLPASDKFGIFRKIILYYQMY